MPTPRRPSIAALAAAAALAACAQPERAPVDRTAWDAAARRLLEPYLTDTDVGCGELLIEISPNFYSNVGQPAIDPNLHGARKERGPGYDETIWTNRVGDISSAFNLTIGDADEFTERGIVRGRATRFTVLHEVRLRVYTGSDVAVRLDAHAGGQTLVLNEGGRLRDLAEWRVENGVLHVR